MADFKLPNLGEGVDSGDVVGVSVKAGDSVTKGQSMLEVETNKAVMDVPAPANAKITAVKVKVGDKVVYKEYSTTEVKVDGAEYLIIKEEDVLAVLAK